MIRDSYGHPCRPGVLAVSPPDNGPADYCSDMLITGEHILARRPHDLMAILAEAPSEFHGALADLLQPAFDDPIKQTKGMRKLAEWIRQDERAKDLTFEVLADMADEFQPDYSDED